MISSIAVLTDFSPASKAPFLAAGDLARRTRCPLYVLFAEEDVPVFADWELAGGPLVDAARRSESQAHLEQLVREEPAFAGADVRPQVLAGGSAAGVAEFQAATGIDLLMLATHGYTGIRRFLLGSFANKVVRLSTCPVLLFRVAADSGEGESTADTRPSGAYPFRRILACHDFSKASDRALAEARVLATLFAAETRLFFVAAEEACVYAYAAKMEKTFDEYKAGILAEAVARLERLVARDWHGLSTGVAASVGHPAQVILEESERWGADLVVLGSQGRSVLGRLLLGSVTEKVAQRSAVPVLIVHRPQ